MTHKGGIANKGEFGNTGVFLTKSKFEHEDGFKDTFAPQGDFVY